MIEQTAKHYNALTVAVNGVNVDGDICWNKCSEFVCSFSVCMSLKTVNCGRKNLGFNDRWTLKKSMDLV